MVLLANGRRLFAKPIGWIEAHKTDTATWCGSH